MIYYQ